MQKIVFITGATAGFGEAAAYKFASHGYDLILNGRRTDRLQVLSDELEKKYNVAVLQLPFDVQDEKAVLESIENIPADWKAIDVLVNNAGLALGRDYFEEADLSDWNTMIDTNVKGFLYVGKAVSQLMAARKQGHIINMGSVAGKQVYEKGNVYCATKYAVDAISQARRSPSGPAPAATRRPRSSASSSPGTACWASCSASSCPPSSPTRAVVTQRCARSCRRSREHPTSGSSGSRTMYLE